MATGVEWKSFEPLAPIERAVVCLLAFVGGEISRDGFEKLLGRRFNGATASTLEGVLKRLQARKLPIQTRHPRSARSRKFFSWTGFLTLDCARKLIQSADANKWWPSASLLAQFDYVDGQANYSSYMRRLYPQIGTNLSAVLALERAFILGSEIEDFVPEIQKKQREPVGRAAANRLVSLLEETPSFASGMDPVLYDGLLPFWLNRAFMQGRDVRPILRVVEEALRAKRRLSDDLVRNYAALCVWTGFAEGLEVCGKQQVFFVNGCRLALGGQFAQADTTLRRLRDAERGRQFEDYDNLPERALMMTLCMAGKPGVTRPKQMMKGSLAPDRFPRFCVEEACYRQAVETISAVWNEEWKGVWDGQGAALRAVTNGDARLFVNLLLAWDYQRLVVGRARFVDSAKKICDWIPRLYARGYLNFAGLFLSLMCGGYHAEQYADIIAAVDASGTWFLPRRDPEPEWKSVLGILRKELDKAVTVTQQQSDVGATRTLVWKVKVEKDRDTSDGWRVSDISPVLIYEQNGKRKRLRADIGALSHGFEGYLQSTNDRLLQKLLQSRSDYYYYNRLSITREVIEQLCVMTNLEREDDFESDDWRTVTDEDVFTPVTFEVGSCSFESSVREDGGVALSVPNWLLTCRDDYAIRKIAQDRYAYVFIPASIAHMARIFNEYGDKGRIELPQEAMASAQDVLEDLGSVVPLANPSDGKVDDLPRINGASACSVRLDFAEGVLSVRAVVRPLEGNAALVVEPGLGLAEKLVTGAAGSYWLVRNLDAERFSFQTIRTALADAEDWFDGRAAWQIDDLPTAIESLIKLKALEPAVPLEWMDARRLNVVNAPKSGVQLQSSRTADEWFSVKGTFALDDGRVVNVLDLLASMSAREGRYVRLSDGDYVALTKSMAKELEALAAVGRKKGGALEVSRAALPMLDNVFDGSDEESLALPEAMAVSAEEIRTALRAKPKVPIALQATLRPYQTEGYTWLSRLAACGFGSCLADDMGLGKTVQIIALLLERIADGVSLVIAPSSVCGNWRNEIRRFAPTLNPILALECADDALPILKSGDVLIASYGYLLFHEDAFAAVTWNGLVLDEAQAIKNDASKRAHIVKRLHARFRVAATGTPVENHLGELWSLFDFLNPGLLGPITSFAGRFIKDGKAVPALKKVVKPLILRRLKGDVLDDLPEKTEVTIPVELGKEERSAYEGCRLHALAALADKDSQEDRFSILAELTRLRRFCCHPSLVLGADAGIPSAKMEALVDLLESLHQGQHKALIFSQFTDYLKLVQQVVTAHGWSFKYLDGSTPTKERERLVNEFQTGESEFFLISLKAGGTGLNLTAANYVILLDPWWNPAVENQAADRAHRIGQKQPVTVYRLVSSDTVEERVIELHKEKTALAADLLEGTAKSSFTPADLIKLFAR